MFYANANTLKMHFPSATGNRKKLQKKVTTKTSPIRIKFLILALVNNCIFMKRLLITIAAIIISVCTFAQMVPDQFTETVTLTDQDGNTHDINAYLRDGKYVVLDFFFTTCHYCQEEMPEVVATYREMGCNEADVIFIGVAVANSNAPNTVEWYMNEFHVEYPIAPLETNPINETLFDNWELDGTPTYICISPDRSMRELDRPINYGSLVALGARQSACPDNMPVADFTANRTRIPAGETVTFSNLSQRSTAWSWTFQGGDPASSTDENPTVTYNNTGRFTVTLTARNRQGNEDTKTRTSYIEVVDPPTEPPTAYFAANQVTVIAGNTINFTDLSRGEPWTWQWTFEGAQPTSSNEQHPHNIRYNNIGTFNVTLIVSNTLGADTLKLENYIHVIPSIGDAVPKAKFSCSNRLVQVNTPVNFVDQSEGYPMFWSWEFEGGTPASSEFQILPEGVIYENSGVYDVTLAVSNTNGGDILTKHDYVVVYENYVGSYCDTLCNLRDNETAIKLGSHDLTSGYLGGTNSDRIETYADKFEYYTFNEISSITVPIMKLEYSNSNAYITFITWDGNDPVPTTVISEKKVYLRDLRENYFQEIRFIEPLKVDGPFYLGYTIPYSSGTEIVIGLAPNRGYGRPNTLFVLKDGEWKSVPDAYDDISTSTGIKIAACLNGDEVELFSKTVSIYPNPCENLLNIENTSGFEPNDFIEIFDNLGRLVYSNNSLNGEKVEINVSNLPIGTYVTRMFTQGKIAVQKFEKMN